MAFCGISLSRSLLGVNRTSLFALPMSAFDPKRTCIRLCRVANIYSIYHLEGPYDLCRLNCALDLRGLTPAVGRTSDPNTTDRGSACRRRWLRDKLRSRL